MKASKKKLTKVQLVAKYLLANPKATGLDVKKHFGVATSYAYVLMASAKKLNGRIGTKEKVAVEAINRDAVSKLREVSNRLNEMTAKLAHLEQALTEKDKEVWTLECEVFDKKAIINYLEGKIKTAGVTL